MQRTELNWRVGLAIGCLGLAAAPEAMAHVKWFSDFDFLTPPLEVAEVASPIYRALLVLSTLVISCLVLVDRRLDTVAWYRGVNEWLTRRRDASLSVMRLAMAALLLLSWSSDAVLAPELASQSQLLVWLQFVVAILLLFEGTVMLGGLGILAIFFGATLEFGLFHMLDYLHDVGIGLYLILSQSKRPALRDLGLPALYSTVGFSLIWLAYEKLFYPSWALYLLEQNPQLALGLAPEFFLQGAAFVEICLGFLLLIGLLERPLAAVITLIFFSTTLIFGKVEVIGHTPVHAALVVFLLSGAGTLYKPPIAIHKKLTWRVAFAAVNFIAVAALFLGAYSWSAQRQYQEAMAEGSNIHGLALFELDGSAPIPAFERLEVIEEAPGSYDLHVRLTNWTFTPEKNGQPTVANEGHGHIFVNGRKVGRLYGPYFHLGPLEPGPNHVVVTLNGNGHRDFTVDGQAIRGETTFDVP